MRAWIRSHPGLSALVLGAVLVLAGVVQLGDQSLTVGGVLTLLLPVIVAVAFYVFLRIAISGNPPSN